MCCEPIKETENETCVWLLSVKVQAIMVLHFDLNMPLPHRDVKRYIEKQMNEQTKEKKF